MKKCSRCEEIKSFDEFHKSKHKPDGVVTQCKSCMKEKQAIYYINNKKKCNATSKRWRISNKIKKREIDRIWKAKNPEKVKEHNRRSDAKSRSTEKGKLADNISRAVRFSLKSGGKKQKHWEELLGYTTQQLFKRLSKTMPDGYAWDDYLNGLLQVDHIIPWTAFNFNNVNDIDFKRCWALKNLQLLPSTENRRKSNNLKNHFQPSLAI